MLHVLDHPLAAHVTAHLRDKTTKPATFRTLCYQISLLLAIDATRDLATEIKDVETPLERAACRVLAHQPLVVVPILRAGLGMVQPFLDLFPDVSVGYIGLERDHATAIARSYYCKLPPLSAHSRVLLVDPMLATGGSAVQALDALRAQGAADLRLLSIVSAPEGIAEVRKHYPELPIFTAAVDRELNSRKYILPGLGDFGDRLYGT
ncbi:uracil phosphoribosyltransferase [Opitutus terrae]|uniref:Uracil phosphoribosyltransferase n=1 Tax=Opitutus terrae (strain DSM 11246 / JCM 15787 / PB90-1) TaxID=452637 RepID=B1ZVM3_OPITP|nr:uracil phosphoribosyltransferase [Opitutus terrae]ACB74120.1 uracil phosphoribosyltransferase [Opitutus terrae PB90-1]